MLIINPPAFVSARDLGLRFHQRFSFVQDTFVMFLSPDYVTRSLPVFIDLTGRKRFEGSQNGSDAMWGAFLDFDDSVNAVGHQGKGIESDIGKDTRQVMPMCFCHSAEDIWFHSSPGNSAQTCFLPARVYGEEIKSCLEAGFLALFRGGKGVRVVSFHLCFPVAVFDHPNTPWTYQ